MCLGSVSNLQLEVSRQDNDDQSPDNLGTRRIPCGCLPVHFRNSRPMNFVANTCFLDCIQGISRRISAAQLGRAATPL